MNIYELHQIVKNQLVIMEALVTADLEKLIKQQRAMGRSQ
jgi:hypothetical protein